LLPKFELKTKANGPDIKWFLLLVLNDVFVMEQFFLMATGTIFFLLE